MTELAICGTFLDNDYRSSGYMQKLFADTDIKFINGGYWEELSKILKNIENYDAVYWFPDISNDKDKLLPLIKKVNPRCILISSKNNIGNKYSHKDIIARALSTKSNLLLEFTKKDGLILATLHDPLGNVFVKEEQDINKVRSVMLKRTKELKDFTRVRSVRVGDKLEIPNKEIFFNIVKDYADEFHNLIHAANSDRLLGNASFRCERGFPGFRHNDKIFVSRRNVDKRFIEPSGFVAVEPKTINWEIFYYGDMKPSVDTPIQLQLFAYYKNINYILHSHVYVEGAPFTDKVIPCGAIEEFDHIIKIEPNRETYGFCINLRGHGSIALASTELALLDIPYIPRPAPEEQTI